MTVEEYYKEQALRFARHHKEHCDGATCNMSLSALREMAEKAGVVFTAEERKEFV